MISYGAFMGVCGFSLACYSNMVRKLPAMRRPWEHVLYAGAGYYIGTKIPAFKEKQRADLEQMEGGIEMASNIAKFRFTASKDASTGAPESS